MIEAERKGPKTLYLKPGRGPSKPKIKRWSHQDELEALRGRKIMIFDGERHVAYTLLEADQFALKVEAVDKQVVILWKHALKSVRAI
jgi:hypothetical protein